MDQHDKKIISLIGVIMFVVLVGTVFYHNFEDWRFLDAFYFSTTTLTTVGFGDLHPTTDASKIFTIFYVLFGVGIMLYSITLIGSHYMEEHHPAVEKAIFSRINRDLGTAKKFKDGIIGRQDNNGKMPKDEIVEGTEEAIRKH